MPKFSDEVYDRIKWVSRYFLPALAALYVAVADAWGLSHAAQVSATITAIALFINATLGISGTGYWKTHSIVKDDAPDEYAYTSSAEDDEDGEAE